MDENNENRVLEKKNKKRWAEKCCQQIEQKTEVPGETDRLIPTARKVSIGRDQVLEKRITGSKPNKLERWKEIKQMADRCTGKI